MEQKQALFESREGVITALAYTSLMGSLGLFVGTGFSIAASAGAAPRFEQLLQRVAERLRIDFRDADPALLRRSLPQVASVLVSRFAEARGISSPEAERAFKAEVSRLTDIKPTAVELGPKLKALTLAWIITTNYDLVLESLLDEAESLRPNQPFVARYGGLPIYHLHGHRRFPESIRITEEDYVGMIGPIDYQRLKLPLLMLESTTLMVGYGLGDVNVRGAMAWARTFCGDRGLFLEGTQGVVVQALFQPFGATRNPFPGPEGEIVLEVASIASLLDEIATRRNQLEASLNEHRAEISAYLASNDNAARVQYQGIERSRFLEIVRGAQWPLCTTTTLLEFLDRALSPIWETARGWYNFSHYETYLSLVLDVAQELNLTDAHPNLVAYLGDALDRVGEYIGPAHGQSWAAHDTWLARSSSLSPGLISLLNEYASVHEKTWLQRLLAAIPAEVGSRVLPA